MTAPVPPPRILPNNQPLYIRQPQDWALQQEQMRHVQAIYWVGEPALFLLLWKVEDFEAGYVGRCPRCRVTDGSVDARIEKVYKQPVQAQCPWCFGTSFDGGVRSKVVRPTIFNDSNEAERKSARGVTYPEATVVETTNDFRARQGDFVCRQDGSRWQLSTPNGIQLRTGFLHPNQTDTGLGYATIPATREDRSSVAFQIPPNATELDQWLTPSLYWPQPENNMEAGPSLPPDEFPEFA
jgi:hypothetical protein